MTAPTLFDPIQETEIQRVSGQIAKIILMGGFILLAAFSQCSIATDIY